MWDQIGRRRDEILPFHLDTQDDQRASRARHAALVCGSQAAWNQGRFGHGPSIRRRISMGYYQPEDIPFQFALAEAFTICDALPLLGDHGDRSQPHRLLVGFELRSRLRERGREQHDADSEPDNLRCWIKGSLPEPGYTYQGSAFNWPTIPDVLEGGITWRIYQDPNDNWTGAMHGGLAFESFRDAKPGSPIYEKRHGALGRSSSSPRMYERGRCRRFRGSCRRRDLVRASPASARCRAPIHRARARRADRPIPRSGARPSSSMTFDENDGLFDHVPAAAPPSYNPDGKLAGKSTVDARGSLFLGSRGQRTSTRQTPRAGRRGPGGWARACRSISSRPGAKAAG